MSESIVIGNILRDVDREKFEVIESNLVDITKLLEELKESLTPSVGTYIYSLNNPQLQYTWTEWEQVTEGNFLIASGETYTPESSYGSNTLKLTTENLPAHTHTLNGHTHKISSHTHQINGHTHTLNSHTHTLNNHTHSIAAHNHSFSATTSSSGSHQHTIDLPYGADWLGGVQWWSASSSKSFPDYKLTSNSAGAHTHTISGTTGNKEAFNTGSNNGNTGGSGTLTSNSSGTLTSNGSGELTSQTSGTLTSNSSGSGTSFSKIPQSIAIPLWVRVK